MGDGFAHGGHIRCHHRGLHRHRFEQRPAEHKGHGQINMAAADADDTAEIIIGHLTEEMHPVPVDAIAEFCLHLAAQPLGVAALCPVRGVIAANHQDPGLRSCRLDLRQGAHHDVKAAGAFHVAGHIGHHLIRAGQGAVQPSQPN